MPYPIKIHLNEPKPPPPAGKTAAKSRLKRLLEKQFPKLAGGSGEPESEPSTVCLDSMVLSFMEDGNEKPPARNGRSRCNFFNGNSDDSSDDESSDDPPPSVANSADVIKGLIHCESIKERNLLADASRAVESTKTAKNRKNCIRIVAEYLRNLGLDVSICKSRWEKTPSIPAGEYEYIDVVIGDDRFIIDIDFRSEFEIARSTKAYRAVLQSLPSIFVGKPDRLQKIVALVSEAARQSLKKKGLHFPPWRKPEYVKAKWLSPYDRVGSDGGAISDVNFTGGFEMRREMGKLTVVVSPAVRVKSVAKGVTGLSLVLTEKTLSPLTPF